MNLLVRRIKNSAPWIAAADLNISDPYDIPVELLRDFIPSEADKHYLSLFEVADAEEALRVAAGMAFSHPKIASEEVHFLSASIEVITNTFDVVFKMGKTKSKFADRAHREIEVRSIKSSSYLAYEFLKGEMFSFQGQTLSNKASEEASINGFIYEKLDAAGFNDNPKIKNLVRFINDRSIIPIGSKVPVD